MPKKSKRILLANEVPWADALTPYDEAHFTLYVRLIDAIDSGALMDEMCEVLLKIDPAVEQERAYKCLESHLKRARWFTDEGFRHLIDEKVLAAAEEP